MLRFSWGRCCAVVLLTVSVLTAVAIGEEVADLFGTPANEQADLEPVPGAKPARIQSGDKSLLTDEAPTPDVRDPTPADERLFGETAKPIARPATPHEFCRCVGDTSAPNVAKIEQALRGPLHENGLECNDQPLEEVVSLLQEEYGIPIKLDTKALDDLGIGSDEQVTVNLHGISFRAALRLMLKELGLTYIIQDEVLLISTPDEAEHLLRICVYDVRDLKDVSTASGRKKLIDAIVSCSATETWAENGGGEAEVRMLEPGLLVVSQTQAVHEEVRALLETIRATYAQPALGQTMAAVVPEPAAEISDKVVTRSYALTINQPAVAEKTASQIWDLITKSLPEEQWTGRLDDGQPVVLTVLPDRIVLRHREAVQKEVQTLLSDSGIASPAAEAVEVWGGGGGFGVGIGGGGGGFGGGYGGGGGVINPQPADAE